MLHILYITEEQNTLYAEHSVLDIYGEICDG
jgi:hypothetical protein